MSGRLHPAPEGLPPGPCPPTAPRFTGFNGALHSKVGHTWRVGPPAGVRHQPEAASGGASASPPAPRAAGVRLRAPLGRVSSGCRREHTDWGLNQQAFPLAGLGAGGPRSGCTEVGAGVRTPLPACRQPPSRCLLRGQRVRGGECSSDQGHRSHRGSPSSWPHLTRITSQRLHLQAPPHGGGASAQDGGGGDAIQSTAPQGRGGLPAGKHP